MKLNLVLRTTLETETMFYELLRSNPEISLKDMCRKVPKKMAYKYLKSLLEMQEKLGKVIIEKRAGTCKRTGMPVMILEKKIGIFLESLNDGAFVYFAESGEFPIGSEAGNLKA